MENRNQGTDDRKSALSGTSIHPEDEVWRGELTAAIVQGDRDRFSEALRRGPRTVKMGDVLKEPDRTLSLIGRLMTPVVAAAACGDTHSLQVLLEAGASGLTRTKNPRTAPDNRMSRAEEEAVRKTPAWRMLSGLFAEGQDECRAVEAAARTGHAAAAALLGRYEPGVGSGLEQLQGSGDPRVLGAALAAARAAWNSLWEEHIDVLEQYERMQQREEKRRKEACAATGEEAPEGAGTETEGRDGGGQIEPAKRPESLSPAE